MKKSILILEMLFLLWGSSMQAQASQASSLPAIDSIDKQYDIDGLQKGIQSLFPKQDIPVKEMLSDILKGDLTSCFERAKESVKNLLWGEAAGMKKIAVNILVVSMLSGIFARFSGVFENHQVADISFYIVYLLLVTMLLAAFGQAAAITTGMLEQLLLFMKLFIPTYFCAVGMAAGTMTAYSYYHLMLLLIYIIEILISAIIIPAIYGYVFLSIMNGMWMEEKLNMLMELLKKGVLFLLKAFITIVTGISIIQSMITPVIDSVKGAAVKKAFSAIPGIGGMVSGVTEMVVGSAVLIKNGIGTLFMLLLIMLCAVPVIKLSMIAFLLKATAAISGVVADKRLTHCTDCIGDGGTLLLKSMMTVAVLFIITVAIISYSTNRGF